MGHTSAEGIFHPLSIQWMTRSLHTHQEEMTMIFGYTASLEGTKN